MRTFWREGSRFLKGTAIALLVLIGGGIGGIVATSGHASPPVRLVQKAATVSKTTTTTAPSAPTTTAPPSSTPAPTTTPAPASNPAPSNSTPAPTATTTPTTTAPQMVTVPNVVGMTPSTAEAALQAVGLSWVWGDKNGTTTPITSQSPRAGVPLAAGGSLLLVN